MSLITLKSKFDTNDTASDFKCDFPQSLEIAPKSEVELINFQFKRKEEYKIDENNDILIFIIGGGTLNQQRQIHIPHGTYTGNQLVKTIAQVANEATVNSAFRNIIQADGQPTDGSGWKGSFSQKGGTDPGGSGGDYPLIEFFNDQNGYSVVSGTGSTDGKSWRFANVSNGDELPTSQYTIVENTTDGTTSNFTPGSAGADHNNFSLSRNIISNYGMYDGFSTFNTVLRPTQGGRLPQSNFITNYTITTAGSGYFAGETGNLTGGSGVGATYRIDSVDGSGGLAAQPSFYVVSEGANYAPGDVLTFQGGNGDATITVNNVSAATGYAKTRTGVSRYTTFFPRGASLSEQWNNTLGDFMCEIDDNRLTLSSLTYSSSLLPGTPGYRTTVISPGRDDILLSSLDYSGTGLPAPNFGTDHLKIIWQRTNMRMQCLITYDTAGNGTFGTPVLVGDTNLGAGVDGKLTASMAEIRFPYIPFIYAATGVDNHNVLTVDALYSPFSILTIILAQNNHIDGYNNSSRGIKWTQQDGVSSKISETQLAALDVMETSDHLGQSMLTAPGDIINVQFTLKINFLVPQDLQSGGGILPDNLLEPNIANAGPTLGDNNVNFFFESSANYSTPTAYKFDSPLTGDFDTTYFIELPDLPIKSHNGFSTDVGKSIMVVPREQLTTGEFEGVMYYQPPYPVRIRLHNIDMMRLNSLRVQIRNSDGTLCTDLDKPSQLLIKISPTEPSIREALRELGKAIGIRQDTKIDTIGDMAPRI